MRGRFAILLVLFVGSGCAALIYEIVWFQLLRLTIGASAVSLGIILATFMGGMCLGGLLFHRWISERHHPLAVYGWLELGIAAFGLLNLLLIPAIGGLYFEITGYGYGDILLRGAIAALFLLPPTCLMGATLPAISRHVERSRRGVASLGFLYSANTAGAVLGTVLAGFYLLRVHDTWVATAVAIGLNLGAGGLALALAQRQPRAADSAPPQEPLAAARHGIAFAVIGISGFTALGAQVVWTRLLALYFGGSVYTFSIILAVFLVGLGIGSSAGARLSRSRISPALALAVSQLLLIPALFWGSFAINELIHTLFPFGQLPVDWLVKCANDVLRTGLTLLPATLLWGLSFPLALALVAEPEEDPSRFTGRLYAANTFGAVAGALLFSLWLIPWVGTRSSQQILAGAAALAVLLMVPAVVRPRTTRLFAVAAGTIATLSAWGLPGPFYPLLGIFLAFFWLYNIIDAGRRAAYYNQALDGVAGVEMPAEMGLPSPGGSLAGGVALIIVGFVLLSNTVLGFSLRWLEEWWPAAPILFGIYLVYRGVQERSE